MVSHALETVFHTGPELPANSGASLRSTDSSSSAANSSTAAVVAESSADPLLSPPLKPDTALHCHTVAQLTPLRGHDWDAFLHSYF
jgi:hypothetical protein